MGSDYREILRKYRKSLIREESGRDDRQSVTAQLRIPDSLEERDMAAMSQYQLVKEACAEEDFASARDHAAAVEQLTPSDRSLRTLISQRLRLLKRRPNVVEVSSAFDPGLVYVPRLGDVVVLGRYESRGRRAGLTEAILLLKKAPEELESVQLNAREALIARLGLLMWDALRRTNIARAADVLVPIPPDSERYATRGYHPPEAVARALSRHATIPCVPDVLAKLRPTRSLRRISDQREREEELRGSMGVNEARRPVVVGRHVLLVDDVVTYGTHFREAKKMLISKGAESVHAMALATAHGHPTPFS